MIYSDIQGKTSSAEDRFTSIVLDLLSLLPASELLDFLLRARAPAGQSIPVVFSPQSQVNIAFWPYLSCPRVCISDALVTIHDPAMGAFRIVIECKIGADQSGNQLADYWKAANIHYNGRFALIYMTHVRTMPKKEIEKSQWQADRSAHIYWLNWYSLFTWVQNRLSDSTVRPYSEQQILFALSNYLAEKDYQTFRSLLPLSHNLSIIYRRIYCRKVPKAKATSRSYARTYCNNISSKLLPLPYTRKLREQ